MNWLLNHNRFNYEDRHRISELLEIILSDVNGTIRFQSISGAKYFITFIDDKKSSWTKVWLLKRNSEYLDAFNFFKIFSRKLDWQQNKKFSG